jgi:uncharacterized membrane protein (UPF0127 family)
MDSYAAGLVTRWILRDKIVELEIANTEKSRRTGLMNRKALCENCGMFFIFPFSEKWVFWSKNTPLALSVAYVDEDGHILQIVDMEPNSTKTYTADSNVLYVLEMQRGWFSRNGISLGDKLVQIGY